MSRRGLPSLFSYFYGAANVEGEGKEGRGEERDYGLVKPTMLAFEGEKRERGGGREVREGKGKERSFWISTHRCKS